ncbi:MAG: hypothetical protein NUV34_10030 [Sulfuricaulis sp.]|nr:hypothetical protein [Sulfuricaulis sp.]
MDDYRDLMSPEELRGFLAARAADSRAPVLDTCSWCGHQAHPAVFAGPTGHECPRCGGV